MIRRRGPWRTLEAVEFATLEWVGGFNHRRLLDPIGNTPPAEAEARYYAQTEDVAMAGGLTGGVDVSVKIVALHLLIERALRNAQ